MSEVSLKTLGLALQCIHRRRPGVAVVALLLLLVTSIAKAQTVKLDNGWHFLVDKGGTLKVGDVSSARGWRNARVGLSWNAQFEDLRDYMGVAWYRTTFESPDLRDGRRALLRFDAVDYYSKLFVNGKAVGTHEGGYTPFSFDITDALHAGTNELVVRVVDPPMDEKENRARLPDMLYNEIPHGKQNWYVQTGGIWQTVFLEVKPKLYIEQVHVSPRVDGQVRVEVSLSAGKGFSGMFNQGLQVTVRNSESGVEFTQTLRARDATVHQFSGKVKVPRLWSPAKPVLYRVEVRLEGNEGAIGQDSFDDSFGFRSFEAHDGKFYLNGEPFYMIAALDQDFYPETIYTPPSEKYLRDQMLKAKQLGLNLLRCHIKVCDPSYLKVADEVGMLVWYEIPSWNDLNHFTPKAAERGETTFREMVERDWNHPSIVIQSIINESWGADLKQENQRRWLRAAYERAKKLTAPLARLVVDNSACCDNFHLKTDIEDNHRYNSIPDDYLPFDKWVADFAGRPSWNFSPYGDGEPTGREPLVVSEFGNWGLPKLPKDLPWWFDRGFGDRPVTKPAGLLRRFNEFKFARLFPNYDALAEATQWHQFVSLKHEIEEIRRYSSIQGYVITEFTDINWEANGLMSMWREPKAYAAELRKIQEPDLVIVRTDKNNYASGEPIKFDVLFSHYSQRDLRGAKLVWRNEAGKLLATDVFTRAVAPASVTPIGSWTLPAPAVKRPLRQRIRIELLENAGGLIAGNTVEVFIYPRPKPAVQTALSFRNLQQASGLQPPQLAAAGYQILDPTIDLQSFNRPTLVIARTLDEGIERHLRQGGRALILADSKEALPTSAPLKVTARAGTDLDGNWVTNFNWVRSDLRSPFSAVTFDKILGFESEHVVPRFVIQGINGANYDDVLSGIFYGWLNNNAALAAQMRVGRGKLLLTTFRFDDYGRDPYATHLLDSLIRYASGPTFHPKFVYKGEALVEARSSGFAGSSPGHEPARYKN